MNEVVRRISNVLPDKLYLKLKYYLKLKKRLNLRNPQTFNEKLQWLKLYDRKPEYTMMVDKIEVRKYIAGTIGEEYLIPCLGTWGRAEDIDFETLPDQFVLKCNHNSGVGMCICKDKSNLDVSKVRDELSKGLKENYYLSGREWPYKNVKPRIIAEKYMGDNLLDYRIYCFNGKAQLVYAYTNESLDNGTKPEAAYCDIFDMSWKRMTFRQMSPATGKRIRPVSFEKMHEFSELLSKKIPFLRVDFYEINRKLYIGELTFSPGSGMSRFYPEEWDQILGDWLKLPNEQEKYDNRL